MKEEESEHTLSDCPPQKVTESPTIEANSSNTHSKQNFCSPERIGALKSGKFVNSHQSRTLAFNAIEWKHFSWNDIVKQLGFVHIVCFTEKFLSLHLVAVWMR